MSDLLPRVAVLGVPRGGTSMVTGLLRILGYALPEARWRPLCWYGEAARLRSLDPEYRLPPGFLAQRVNNLPDGVVWKDPGVGDYADRIDWSRWLTVAVTRQPEQVAESERRHGSGRSTKDLKEDVLRRFLGIQDALKGQGRQVEVLLPFDESREVPRGLLVFLAGALDLPAPTAAQRDAAEEFVRPGYRCPLPETCTLDHSES